jgi:2'-5' RNA ligase
MVRTFIAIELSNEIRENIREIQAVIGQSDACLTFVDPGAAHITLKFLGEIDAGTVGRVTGAIQSVKAAPFRITVDGVAGNSRQRPRVIWGIVHDAGECARLAADIDRVLEPLGIPREGRPFRPHVTIARVKEFHPSLMENVATVSRANLGTATIDGIRFKKSTLTPRGPQYENLAEVDL